MKSRLQVIALVVFLLPVLAQDLLAQSYLMRSQPEDNSLVGLRFMRTANMRF